MQCYVMYVLMYVRTYVCMYVCMYVCIYIYIHFYNAHTLHTRSDEDRIIRHILFLVLIYRCRYMITRGYQRVPQGPRVASSGRLCSDSQGRSVAGTPIPGTAGVAMVSLHGSPMNILLILYMDTMDKIDARRS